MRPHPELPIIPIPLETLFENVERTNGRGRGSEKCVCLISPQSFLPSSLPPSTAHPSSSDSAPANPMPQKAVAQLLLLLFISICFTYTCARWRVAQTQKRGCSSLACQSCHATIGLLNYAAYKWAVSHKNNRKYPRGRTSGSPLSPFLSY